MESSAVLNIVIDERHQSPEADLRIDEAQLQAIRFGRTGSQKVFKNYILSTESFIIRN